MTVAATTARALTADALGASAPGACLCTHCSLPVPAGLVEAGAEHQFCCVGCRTAYSVIHSCGLDRYYALREATSSAGDADANRSRWSGARFAEFDDAAFHAIHVRPREGNLVETELLLEGVHCAACVWLVEKLPAVLPGVVESRLDLRRGIVRVVFDPALAPLSRVARALDSLGYLPHPARNAKVRDLRTREDRAQLARLAVAGACAANVMLLALALYAGLFESMEPAYVALFRWASMLISLVSLAWPGAVFFRGAWAAIRTRTINLDLPIVFGLAAGAVWGTISTVLGLGEAYFDSLSMLVFLLLVGRFIQHRQQRWAGDSVELLFSLTPSSVRLIEGAAEDGSGGSIREASIESVNLGDLVEVRAGDSVPVDGLVLAGESDMDASLLTGESRPVRVRPGDGAAAGTVNLSGVLRLRVSATGEETRIGRLMRTVEEGARRRAPIVRFADRVASWFVVVMIALAVVTLVAWLFIEPAKAVDHAVALLIVACPCALGLATPLALTAAIGRAARRGILIKGGDAVERLAAPGTIFLDKTGTITEGKVAVVEARGDAEALALAAALESNSAHPIAKAIAAWGTPASNGNRACTALHQQTGAGIRAAIDGRDVAVGSPAFIRSVVRAAEPLDIMESEQEFLGSALTPVLVSIDGQVRGIFGLGDPIRPDAKAAISELQGRGWDVRILSGDHQRVAQAVGAQLGLPEEHIRGGVSPEDKLHAVVAAAAENAATRRPVVMVGDGVNDAAALAAADVGIAVHGGAEASLAAADVYISTPGLEPIAELALASRATQRAIYRCLGASLAYNAVAAALAVSGLISPLLAAIFMPASSITVLLLAFKVRTFREGRP